MDDDRASRNVDGTRGDRAASADAARRELVERATRTLATQFDCGDSEALEYLVRLAQNTGETLTRAASAVVGTTVPAGPTVDEVDEEVFDSSSYLRERRRGPGARRAVEPPKEVPQPPEWTADVLDAFPGSTVYACPVRDDSGRIIDFQMLAVSSYVLGRDKEDAADLIGRRMVECDPAAERSGIIAEFAQAYETGEPLERGPFEYVSGLYGVTRLAVATVRAARVGDGLVVSWRFDEAARLGLRWRQAERLIGLGWGEWNLLTDEMTWSPQMYEIYGRDPAKGPVRFDELPGIVVPEDLPIVEGRLRALFAEHKPVDSEHGIRHRGGVRHIRVMHEPVLDPSGLPVAIRTLVQDVTSRRRRERALARARERIAVERRHAEEQRRVIDELREAVMPIPEGVVELPGLRLAVRYIAAGSAARVGGDWYKARRLPDGRVLVAIGDAMGHGVDATAAMAGMRGGLAGLAYTGAEVDRLAQWLNELVRDSSSEDVVTGTAVLGHFDPTERTLCWTRVGHPAPVLVRDGRAELLDVPTGPLLGGTENAEYTMTTTRLRKGDLVLLYTDGIVDRRDADPETLTEALMGAAAGFDGDPQGCISAVLAAVDADAAVDDICLVALQVD